MSETRFVLCGRVFTSVEDAGRYAAAATFLSRTVAEDPDARPARAPTMKEVAAGILLEFPTIEGILSANGVADPFAFVLRKAEEVRSVVFAEITTGLYREIVAACSPRQDF